MKVILKENMKKLGKAGDVVEVNEGYARNFLIPQNKAASATKGGLKDVGDRINKEKQKSISEKKRIEDLVEKLKGVEITLVKKSSEDNKLFGSVTETEITKELNEKGFSGEKFSVFMERHIKEVGTFEVGVKFKYDYSGTVNIKAEKEG